MIKVQDILDQEPIGLKSRDEQFIDPLTYTLAHFDFLVWRRSGMAGDNHPSGRQALIQWQPAAIKELDHLTGGKSRSPSRWVDEPRPPGSLDAPRGDSLSPASPSIPLPE
jgi:hypothetical protein